MATPILERRISDRAFSGLYFMAVIAGIALAIVLFMIPHAALFSPLGFLPVLGVMIYARLATVGIRYRLYPDRLEIESGVLDRKIENVELFRIRDVGMRQGLFGRMLGFGDVYIHSTDSTTPDLHVYSIPDPAGFYQEIRERVSASRAGSRTMILEEGGTLPER
jgi:membrane protein YdbS with pleckstrin-like domain